MTGADGGPCAPVATIQSQIEEIACSQEEDEPESLSPQPVQVGIAIAARACWREQSLKFTQPAVEIPERDLIKPSKASLSPCKSPLERGRFPKTVGEAAFVVHGLRTLGYYTLCVRTVRMCTPTGSSDGDAIGTTHGNRSRRR